MAFYRAKANNCWRIHQRPHRVAFIPCYHMVGAIWCQTHTRSSMLSPFAQEAFLLHLLFYLLSVAIPNAQDILLHTNSTWQLSLMVTRSCTMASLLPSFQPPTCRALVLPLGSFLPAPSCSLIPPRYVVSSGDVPRGVGIGTIRTTPCCRARRLQQPSSQRYRHSLYYF